MRSTRLRPERQECSLLVAVGAPMGVQQKLMRHAHLNTTAMYGGSLLMRTKRDANSKVVRMALRQDKEVA